MARGSLRLRILPHLGGLALICLPTPTQAYLGSFEETDGYRVPVNGQIPSLNIAGDAQFYLNNDPASGFTGVVPPGAFPNTLGDGTHGADLSRYNAGQFGTANGGPGGTALDIADNTGLWRALAGGRLNEDRNAPLYTDTLRDYAAAYRTASARTGSQVLNFYPAQTDLRYDYQFDSRDFAGISPTLTTAHLIEMSFWICPTDWDDTYGGNVLGMALKDASGFTALEIGYTGSNLFQYRTAGGSEWITTAIEVGSQGWSQVGIAIDTANNLASLSVRAYNDTLGQLAASPLSLLSGSLIDGDVGALTILQWDLEGGLLPDNGIAHKNYFDDFSITVSPAIPVPEPGSALLVLTSAVAFWIRRIRRVKRSSNRSIR